MTIFTKNMTSFALENWSRFRNTKTGATLQYFFQFFGQFDFPFRGHFSCFCCNNWENLFIFSKITELSIWGATRNCTLFLIKIWLKWPQDAYTHSKIADDHAWTCCGSFSKLENGGHAKSWKIWFESFGRTQKVLDLWQLQKTTETWIENLW